MRYFQLALIAGFIIGGTTAHSANCVPTKTPQQADVILQQGLSAIKETLERSYNQNLAEYNRTISQQLAGHDARVANAKKTVDEELIRISEKADLNWREASAAAVARYNQTVQASQTTYLDLTQTALVHYDRQNDAARNQYNLRAQSLVAEYNSSVCAVSSRR